MKTINLHVGELLSPLGAQGVEKQLENLDGIAAATALAFLAFGLLAVTGTPYEMRTVGAMTLRTTLWAAIAWFAWRHFRPAATSAKEVTS